MIFLFGYQILSQIYESINSEVYRGIRVSDNQRVILKVLKQDYPTPSAITRYKQEYELTKSLNLEGVIKAYSLEKYKNTFVMILEDFGGESLKIFMNNRNFSLKEFLKIAIKIVSSLAQLHGANIIHKDLNPANIVFNPETEQLKIIDLGTSTRLTRENPTLKNPNVLEGTLAYISPEQTGRMNRSLDYRTDFYSLGVTFYELLTGQLPFETEDYLKLIHFHIAKNSLSPSVINTLIPLVISDLIMKLMAKNAEDRYQSAWGLKADLENCLQQLQLTGKIKYFLLANQDISDKFQIPQKLYGREKEIKTLLNSFARINNHSKGINKAVEMMLITGYSGIGKSALVREIYKPITEKKGYFISGKFDQFQRNIPYSALVNAFRQLVKQLLTESPVILNSWQTKLLDVLRVNGQVIIDVIPEIELIIGKQLPVAELGAIESQNRFNLVFQNFMQNCCSKEHPLVIFLDDLQWADGATLKLIELMMIDSNLQYLFLIGAYRNNEVNRGHPLMIMLDDLRKSEVTIHQITLDNLTLKDLNQLIADTFKSDFNQVKSLAKLVFDKTKGNPFFIKQFLNALYLDKLIYFDYNQHKWQWDILKISTQNITDNVVELMINELKFLPKSTQLILQLASCIGANFDLHTLSIVEEKAPKELFKDLMIAINSGLILPLSELDENLLIQNYQFLHDRIQEAAYALIPEVQKSKIHLQIGQLLLENVSDIERKENLFAIVDHFNIGRKLITELSRRKTLARLNLEAGNKAKKATAYAEAKVYLKTGIELLSDNCWENEYQLTLNLYISSAEVAYLNGDFEDMETIAKLVLQTTNIIFERVKIYEIQLVAYTTQGKIFETIKVGKKALAELGIQLPSKHDQFETNKALQHLANQLHDRQIEELIDLPVMKDAKAKAIMSFFWKLYSSIFQGMPELLPFQSSTMVSLSLQFGNTPASAVGYAIHGMVLCAFFGEVEKGYRFGKLAINLINQSNQYQFKSMILQIFGSCIQPRKEALRATLIILKDAYGIGREKGDFLTAGYTILVYGFTGFFAGVELATLQAKIESYGIALTQIKQYSAKIYLDMVSQTIENFRENMEQPDCLIGTFYDETLMLPQHSEQLELTALAQVYIYKLLLAYYFGNYSSALDYIVHAQSSLMAVSSIIFYPIYHFYAALTYLTQIDYPENTKRAEFSEAEILATVETHQKILSQWVQTAPMNHLHQWHLIEAEKQRILGNKADAIEHYDRAIQLAKENEYLHEEALANELAAKFYLNWGKEKLVNFYLQESYYAYTLWGAKAKVKDLESKYPKLLTSTTTNTGMTRKLTSETSTGRDSGAILDLATVIKANQAIASEIVLENLLQTLIKILLENSGSTKGCLLLHTPNTSEELSTLEIAIYSSNDTTILFPEKSIAESLPESILNYVARTQENVILDWANLKTDFVQDTYIQSVKPFSILCYPLLNQGNLIGVVYLENNLTTEAFTANRIELLQLLSGQAAIAITNAQLYNKLKDSEEQLKQFLEAIPVGIGVLDANGHPYYLNQKGKYLTGKDALSETTVGEIAEVYKNYVAGTNKLYPNEKLPIIRALRGQISNADDIEIHQGDRIIPIEAWGTPIYNEAGSVQYAMVAFQDITERKQAQKLLSDYNRILEQQVKKRTAELQKVNHKLLRLANLDGLTQIANRRRFDDYLSNEWQRHLEKQEPLALILTDVDYFKRYNDHYGHLGGDDCLIRVAQTIAQIPQRLTDLVARYGGEEFAVILPKTNPEGALIIAEEIKKAIALLSIPHAQSQVSQYVTLSLGVASLIPTLELNLEDLIAQADQALYTAKDQGRDQAIVFQYLSHRQ